MANDVFAQFGGCGFNGGFTPTWRQIGKSANRFLPPVSPAIEPPPPLAAEAMTPYEKMQVALKRPITIDLNAMPLDEFAKWLEKELKIPVALDTPALEAADISSRTPLTKFIAKARAKDALRTVLAQVPLMYVIRDEGLLITSLYEAENTLQTVLYDVADLVAVIEPKTKTRQTNCQPLIDLIKSTCGVPKPGWVDDGGVGSVREALTGIIAISQTPEVYEQIDELLATLRRIQVQHRKSPPNTVFPSQAAEGEEEEQELRKKLDVSVTLDFKDTPLDEAVQFIARTYQTNVALDFIALEAAGIPRDTPVTFQRKDTPLGKSLAVLLRDLSLKLYIHGGVALIADAIECEVTNRVRLYPIRDLLSHLPEGRARVEAAEELCELLMSSTGVPKPGWVDDGGVGTVVSFPRADVLVVAQTPNTHEEIEAFLANLRRTIRPAGRTLLGRVPNRDFVLTLVIDRDKEDKLRAQPADVARIIAKLLPDVDWQADGALLEPLGDRIIVRNTEAVLAQVKDVVENELRGLFIKHEIKSLPGGFF